MIRKWTAAVRRLLADDRGATMVEYALMVALVAAVAIAGVTALGGSLNTSFSGIAGSV